MPFTIPKIPNGSIAWWGFVGTLYLPNQHTLFYRSGTMLASKAAAPILSWSIVTSFGHVAARHATLLQARADERMPAIAIGGL